MPGREPEVDVVNMLQPAVTLVPMVIGTNLFDGPVLPPDDGFVDDLAVFVIPFSGPPPEAFGGVGNTSLWKSNVQVLVRSGQKQYRSGLNLVREIRNLLQSDRAISVPGYMDVQCAESEPLYQGVDDEGLHEFTLSVELTFDE